MNPPSSRARALIGRGVAFGALLCGVLAGFSVPLVFLPPEPKAPRDKASAPRPVSHFTTLDPSALVEEWRFASMDPAGRSSFDPDVYDRP